MCMVLRPMCVVLHEGVPVADAAMRVVLHEGVPVADAACVMS